MTKKLYKFLKSKGDRFEFCYTGVVPILVSGSIDTDLMEEYAKEHTKNISEVLIHFMSYYGDTRTKSNRINEDKLYKKAEELLNISD